MLLAHPTYKNKWSTSPNTRRVPPEVDLESQSLQQSLSLDKNPIDNAEPFSYMTILLVIVCVMNAWN